MEGSETETDRGGVPDPPRWRSIIRGTMPEGQSSSACPSEQTHSSLSSLPSQQELPVRRILVVDDNEDLAVSLARLLRLLYRQEVRVALNARSALEIANDFRPEIMILDLGLPEMDGHDLARLVQRESWSANCLLVVVSGRGQDEDREDSRRAGVHHHLVKPVDPEIFHDLIADHLSAFP